MSEVEGGVADAGRPEARSSQPSGLVDLLGFAALLLDGDGRIVLWSPQAEKVFGYAADEVLGRYAAQMLVHEQHRELMIKLFAHVMGTGESWAGAFPIRHKDGSARLVEFRNTRLLDDRGEFYALGLATDESTLREVERDVALSTRLISQSPMGLAILDTDLRYVSVNPALERMHGIPADDHLGRHYREIMTSSRFEAVEAAMWQVLETGIPMVDQSTVVGRSPADPEHEHAWSISLYRLEDPQGRVLGVAELVVDVTDRHQAAMEAARARWRLALIADSSVRIGTTLEVEKTARELAEVTVPELADVVAVDVLDSVLEDCHLAARDGPALFRALAVKAAYPNEAAEAADPPGHLAAYGTGRLATECVRTGRPILITRADDNDLARIARDDHAAALLARAGVHSYIAVPLTARGQILGFLGLTRARNPLPFDEDDLALAGELASRTAMCIDNACSHQRVRNAAETLQRSLLPNTRPAFPAWRLPPGTGPHRPHSRSAATGTTFCRSMATRPHSLWATSWAAASALRPPWAACVPPPVPSPTSTSTPPRFSSTWTGSLRDWGTPSPPACTPSTTHTAPSATSPPPATCPRPRAQRQASGTARPAHRHPVGSGRRPLRDHHLRPRPRRPAGPVHRWTGRNPPRPHRQTPDDSPPRAGRARPFPGESLRPAPSGAAASRRPR